MFINNYINIVRELNFSFNKEVEDYNLPSVFSFHTDGFSWVIKFLSENVFDSEEDFSTDKDYSMEEIQQIVLNRTKIILKSLNNSNFWRKQT